MKSREGAAFEKKGEGGQEGLRSNIFRLLAIASFIMLPIKRQRPFIYLFLTLISYMEYALYACLHLNTFSTCCENDKAGGESTERESKVIKLHTLASFDPMGLLDILGLKASGFLSKITAIASFLSTSYSIAL